MKHMFVLPCYYNAENPVVINAVKSIRRHHPGSPIAIVDSGSKDKSYFKLLEPFDVIIEDINNTHYDTGAYWHAYQQYPDIDFFYFLHDSIEVYDNLSDLMEHKISSIRYFSSADITGGRYLISSRSDFVKKYFMAKIGRASWLNDIYGFDSDAQKEWAHQQIRTTKYFIPEYFTALFGPMMCVHRSVMDTLARNGIDRILPTNKTEQMAMERIFGIALVEEGYNFMASSLQGNHLKNRLDTSRFNKIILNRA